MIIDAAAQAAVAEFPELRALVGLREEGWRFTAAVHHGEVSSVHGVHVWPGGWADAIGVLSTSDTQGVRADRSGQLVWKREGCLLDVVGHLLELPAPETRTAPRLALGTAPPLWLPRNWP
jgi:hypothetical protein